MLLCHDQSVLCVYTATHVQHIVQVAYNIQSTKRQDDLCTPLLKFILHTPSVIIIHNVEFN